MNRSQRISGWLGFLGSVGFVSLLVILPSESPAFRPVVLGFGILLIAAWMLAWRRQKPTGKETEEEALQRLREEIELRAAQLEKEWAQVRQYRAMHYAREEFPDSNSNREQAEPTEIVSANEWEERDAKVLALMREQSELLFRNLLDNVYVIDGQFDRKRLGDDLITLVDSVARVYQPDSEQPLLETSVEQLLRAVNRFSVQLLVHLDQLPLDVKTYNLRETYQYVRSAAKYYGYYKRVEPYWNYARPVFHLGRLAMGANPITLGVGWAVTELLKQGSVSYAHSYALRLFHDTVRIIGNEAAGIFGGDYRHRELSWIYGAELVHATCTFQIDQASLQAAMQEVTALPLRSEYDRIFLFGCLSQNKSPNPDRFHAVNFLAVSDRQQIAGQLEKFARQHQFEGESGFPKWKTRLESRLGVQLQIGSKNPDIESAQEAKNAIRSLASFLIQFKGKSPEQAISAIGNSRSVTKLSFDDTVSQALQSIADSPPMLFEIPALNPGSTAMNRFLDDLIEFESTLPPQLIVSAAAIEETAGFYREDPATWRKKLDSSYANHLLGDCHNKKDFPAEASLMLIQFLEAGESIHYVFDKVEITPDGSGQFSNQRLTLCGTDNRMLLIASDAPSVSDVLWIARTDDVSVRKERNLIADDCVLVGGEWRIETHETPPQIVIPGRKFSSFDKRFETLLAAGKNSPKKD